MAYGQQTPTSGTLTVIGHSWAVTGGVPQATEGRFNSAAKLIGMLGVNAPNINNLAINGSALTLATSPAAIPLCGWAGVMQFCLPSNAPGAAEAAWTQISDTPISASGPSVIVHGINDVAFAPQAWATQGNPAFQNALTAVISRLRAGAVYGATSPQGTVVWDSSIVFGGSGSWGGQNVGSCLGTGPAGNANTTAGATATITLPSNFTGGTVAVCLICEGNAFTTLDVSGGVNASTTSIPVFSRTNFEQSTIFGQVIQIDSEQMLITGGTGTGAGTFTVTRAYNSTTAASHADGAPVFVAGNNLVTFSGTVANSTGTLVTAGQGGLNGQVGPIVKRIACTAADAGKTIIVTLTTNPGGNINSEIVFDSWWIESSDPPPVVITNVARYPYGEVYIPSSTFSTLNSTINTVAGLFDNSVQVADFDTPMVARQGSLVSQVSAAATSLSVTANSTSFPTTGGNRIRVAGDVQTTLTNAGGITSGATSMTVASATGFPTSGNYLVILEGTAEQVLVTAGQGTTTWTVTRAQNSTAAAHQGNGATVTMVPEDMLCTAVSGSYPNYTLTVTRGYNGTTATAQPASAIVADASWMYTDNTHPNFAGCGVLANQQFQAFRLAQQIKPIDSNQFSNSQSNFLQKAYGPSLDGLLDNGYLYPPVVGTPAAGAPAQNLLQGYPIFIPKPAVLTAMSVYVTTGVAASTYRLGIYLLDRNNAQPFDLFVDCGTVATTSSSAQANITGIWKLLHTGWYVVCAVEQGGSASSVECMPAGGLSWPPIMGASQFTTAFPVGWSSVGATNSGALPAQFGLGGTITPVTAATMPIIGLRLRSKQWQ